MAVNYSGKKNNFLLTTSSGRGQTWPEAKMPACFLTKICGFRVLIWDHDFRQYGAIVALGVCAVFGTFGNIFQLSVPDLWPLS